MDDILQAAANDWFLSMSTLQTLKSRASESMVGVICRQGPHHSAQKSTRTGTSDWITALRQLNSLSNIVFLRFHLSVPPLYSSQLHGAVLASQISLQSDPKPCRRIFMEVQSIGVVYGVHGRERNGHCISDLALTRLAKLASRSRFVSPSANVKFK